MLTTWEKMSDEVTPGGVPYEMWAEVLGGQYGIKMHGKLYTRIQEISGARYWDKAMTLAGESRMLHARVAALYEIVSRGNSTVGESDELGAYLRLLPDVPLDDLSVRQVLEDHLDGGTIGTVPAIGGE